MHAAARLGKLVERSRLSWASTGLAQEKTPFPPLSDKRVYVSGVPDRYQSLAAQINQLKRSSPQTYYVVVVKEPAPARATTDYAKELFNACEGSRPERAILRCGPNPS